MLISNVSDGKPAAVEMAQTHVDVEVELRRADTKVHAHQGRPQRLPTDYRLAHAVESRSLRDTQLSQFAGMLLLADESAIGLLVTGTIAPEGPAALDSPGSSAEGCGPHQPPLPTARGEA